MYRRGAFTLIEVLISITLLGLILPALYKTVDLLDDSNTHLFDYLQKSKKETQATTTFFLDIASSDGNLSLNNDAFDRICIEHTMNSLYGFPSAKVCWVVLKQDRALARVEGRSFHLPVGAEESVFVDIVMQDMNLFDIYWQGGKVVVLLQQEGKEPVTFMVQGVTKPKPKAKKKKKKNKNKNQNQKKKQNRLTRDKNTTLPLKSSSPVKLK